MLAAVALAAGAFYVWSGNTNVSATPISPPSAPAFANIGQAFTVTASYSEDGTSAVLTATEIGAAGSINSCTASSGMTTTIANGTTVDQCTVSPAVSTVATTTTITLSYSCFAQGSVTFSLTQGGVTTGGAYVTCGGSFFGSNICNPALGYIDPACYGQSLFTYTPPTQPVTPPPLTSQPVTSQPVTTAPQQQLPVSVAPPALPIRPPSTGDAGLLTLQ